MGSAWLRAGLLGLSQVGSGGVKLSELIGWDRVGLGSVGLHAMEHDEMGRVGIGYSGRMWSDWDGYRGMAHTWMRSDIGKNGTTWRQVREVT